MLQNAYFLAKIGADTAENEQHFAEILPKTGNYPTGPVAGDRTRLELHLPLLRRDDPELRRVVQRGDELVRRVVDLPSWGKEANEE